MGMPARKFDFEEVPVEERLARLESNVEHIQSDVSEMKVDIRRLNDKIDSLKDQVSDLALTMEKSNSQLRIWTMTFYIGGAGALLTFLAHSLHWF